MYYNSKLEEYHISFNDGTLDYVKAKDIDDVELILLKNTVHIHMFKPFSFKKLSYWHKYIFLIACIQPGHFPKFFLISLTI